MSVPSELVSISSAQNPRYRTWLKLLDSRGIKKNKQAIISGAKFLQELFCQFPDRIQAVLLREPGQLVGFPIPDHVRLFLLSSQLYAALDIYGTKAPLLVIDAPSLPEWEQVLRPGLTLFLPFQNPINLGTTLRSAAALGADVVLLQEAASPYLPKSLRASGPSIFQARLWQGPDLRSLAGLDLLPLFALSPRGKDIFSFNFPITVGLVAGLEGPGLDSFWPEERRLAIPMRSSVESLNAAVAVAMAMACRERQ